MIRSISRSQLVADIVVACVLFVLIISASWQVGAAAVLVAIILCAALAVRRLTPTIALAGSWAGAILQMATLQNVHPANVAILGVLYATACYGSRAVRLLGLVSAVGGSLVAAAYLVTIAPTFKTSTGAQNLWDAPSHGLLVSLLVVVALLAVLGLSWTLGLLARTARTSREARLDARVARERAAYESAVEHERTRIARDMHDVVAHSLAVVIAQADGARYAGAANPALQSAALGTISTTARAALGDVRHLLAELRHDSADSPQPSFGDIPSLLTQMRGAGLRIEASTHGDPAPLRQGSEIAAYRIVQEALTNALRHGDTNQAVTVATVWSASMSTLSLTIRNRIGTRDPVDAVAAVGHGLPGMHERAAIAGGSLSAGRTVESVPTFEVAASLPTAHAEGTLS